VKARLRYYIAMLRKPAIAIIFAATCVAAVALSSKPSGSASKADVTAWDVYEEVCIVAVEREMWPGYDPRDYPLAIYDGEDTYLFSHPSPPDGFSLAEASENVFVYPGQHETMRANTGLEVNGVLTATILLDTLRSNSLEAIAAVAIHEAFHVYQMIEHQDWPWANEGAMLVYPVDDLELLVLRRKETEALRRAVAADSLEDMLAWAAAAIEIRDARFSRLPGNAAEYEKCIELIEGTAHYVQSLAEDNPGLLAIPADGYAAEGVRLRAYATGNAIGVLLDRLGVAWKETLNDEPGHLDDMLRDALSNERVVPVSFTMEEDAVLTAQAREIAVKYHERLQSLRELFDGQTGISVIVQSDDEPLFPRGFDPMNILVLSRSEMLHLRFLRLGNSTGMLEVLDRMSTTTSSGNHPLFEGVRTLIVRGLPEPEVQEIDNAVTLSAEGFTAQFRNARIERKKGDIWIIVTAASQAKADD